MVGNMTDILYSMFSIVIFPGLLFLSLYGMMLEYIDRKLYARLQNRVGPPWFQPLADFIKLIGKETVVPIEAEKRLFKLIPVFALASVVTAFLYIPVWSVTSLYPFKGDVIVVLYLLTIPTLTFFLAGWHSSSLFSAIGAVRTLTQLFAYEVPLFMAILGPAILSGDEGNWSISGISAYFAAHPLYLLFNIPAFLVAIVAIQGKLERVPFDIPEAETEIVAGSFTEYGGKYLAVFRMAIDIELVVVSALLAAIFIPIFITTNPAVGFALFIGKTLFILFILTVIRATMARLRIDQMMIFCWKYLTPVALAQILINLIIKGVLDI
jgi:NADH-quinone oxidoreductase subunit H